MFNLGRDKNAFTLDAPVMPAAGTVGFSDEYRKFIKLEKLGALITNPVTLYSRSAAAGTRVIALDAGILLHTGLPNPGLEKVISEHRGAWAKLKIPTILHFVATTADEIDQGLRRIDEEEHIAGVELGLHDDLSPKEAGAQIKIAVEATEKPILARVPFQSAADVAKAAVDAGASAVVVCAAPRGTTKDASGRFVAGRLYGPMIKPLVLRLVGQISRQVRQVPVIGAGGIHNAQDARDYIEAGARAVQVDSLTWVDPKALELIARDLGGMVITQPSGALPDEWHEGMGETERRQKMQPDQSTTIPNPKKK